MQTACRVVAIFFLLVFSFHTTHLKALTIIKSFFDNHGIIDNDGIVLIDNTLTLALNSLPDNDSNIIGCWRLDESSGNIVSDSKGIHHGTRENMEDLDWIKGVFGNALFFDADNESVVIPNDNTLDGFSEFTLECWVKFLYGITEKFISKDNDSDTSYNIYIDNSGHLSSKITTSTGEIIVNDNNSVGYNKWQHIALVYDNESLVLYIDGNSMAVSSPISGAVKNCDADLIFGKFSYCKLDEVFLRNAALSAQNVSDHAKTYKPNGYIVGKLLEDPDNEISSFNSITVEVSDITSTQKAYVFFSNDGQVFYDNEGNVTSNGVELSNGSNEIPLFLPGFIENDFYYKFEFENNEQGYSTDRPHINSLTLDYSYDSIFYVDNDGSDTSGNGSQSSP